MSDTDRLYALLRAAGPSGVHTLDLRTQGYSGNPSQRATDVEKKYGVFIHRETERRGKRNGSRYTLQGVGKDADPRGKKRKDCLLEAPIVEEVCVSSGSRERVGVGGGRISPSGGSRGPVPTVDSGKPPEANKDGSVTSLAGSSAAPVSGELALFPLPSMNPLVDSEAA